MTLNSGLKFLAIAGHDESLRKRYQIEADERLPILVILQELAEAPGREQGW